MIHFPCPHCRKPLKAADDHAGRKCRCGGCGQTVNIPPAEGNDYVAPANHHEEVAMTNPRPLLLVLIQRFVLVTAILFTACIGILVGIVLFKDYRVYGVLADSEKWPNFGYLVGLWFGGMLTIVTVYLLSEIALALRENGAKG